MNWKKYLRTLLRPPSYRFVVRPRFSAIIFLASIFVLGVTVMIFFPDYDGVGTGYALAAIALFVCYSWNYEDDGLGKRLNEMAGGGVR